MSDKVLHLDTSSFNQTIASSKLVLVDFWAPWCGPCRMLGPTIDALADTVADKAIICKVNVDENPGIAQQYGVNMIPTIIFFKKGERIGQCNSATKEALLAKINEMA